MIIFKAKWRPVYDSTHRQRICRKREDWAVVEVLYASSDHEKVKAKYEELIAQYPENYLAIYDVPLDTDLNTLDHYPSVWIGKEEFK